VVHPNIYTFSTVFSLIYSLFLIDLLVNGNDFVCFDYFHVVNVIVDVYFRDLLDPWIDRDVDEIYDHENVIEMNADCFVLEIPKEVNYQTKTTRDSTCFIVSHC